MRFSTSAITAFCLYVGSASAFSKPAFVPSRVVAVANTGASVVATTSPHAAGCSCATCTGIHTPGCTCSACLTFHSFTCVCAACRGSTSTRLFMSSTEGAEEDVPLEVESLDGIESEDEAHNAERPARSSLKKKRAPKGKELSEFSVGDSVTAKVKTITSYGAFMDFGASTDGLLHISNLSSGFVSDVSEFLKEGDEIEVRIMNIDEKKNQVGLTLLTEEQEEASKQPRQQRGGSSGGGGGGGGQQRRDDGKVVAALVAKGYDPSQFIEGTVASTVDFGAFVRFDASQLNSEVEGEIDGLVHISALSVGRTDSVTSAVNVGDKVQVRCKSIDGRKVSLSMVSVEAEEAESDRRRSSGGPEPVREGAKDWKDSLDRIREDLPEFTNQPLVVDLRNLACGRYRKKGSITPQWAPDEYGPGVVEGVLKKYKTA